MSRGQIIGVGLAAAAWGLIAFGLGLRVHFPEEQLIERLQWEVQERSGGDFALQAGSASPWRMTGVTLKDAVLLRVDKPSPRRRRPRRGAEEEAEEPEEAAADAAPTEGEVYLRAEELALRVEPLALLSGEQAAVFFARLFDGDLTGRVAMTPDGQIINAQGHGLNMALIPTAGEEWSMDLSGRMDLMVDLEMNFEKIKESRGNVEMTFEGMELSAIEMSGFNLDEQAVFTEAVLKLEVDNGKLEVDEGRFISDLVEIELDGYMQLAKTLRRMRMRIGMKIKIADQYDKLLKNLPMVKNARDEEGVYHFMLSGTPEAPRFQEDPSVRRAALRGKPSARRQQIEDRRREQIEGLDPEERKQADADRLERMQDRMRSARDRNPDATPNARNFGPGLRPPGPDGDFGPGRPPLPDRVPINEPDDLPYDEDEQPFDDELDDDLPYDEDEQPFDEEEEYYEDE